MKYLGGRYHGFQYQIKYPTIQGKLNDAINTLFSTSDANVIGCSRTDSGVNANKYYATFTCSGTLIEEEKIPKALNTYLPDDIAVYSAKIVDDNYNLHENVIGKKYVYSIQNDSVKNPFICDRTYFYPKNIDIDKMNEACSHFIGEHDFYSFMASGSSVDSTIRTIYECYVDTKTEYSSNIVQINISGNGFLYNMVRIISGTLLEVSEGKIDVCDIDDIIKSKQRKRAGRTLPGHGLRLEDVFLKDKEDMI